MKVKDNKTTKFIKSMVINHCESPRTGEPVKNQYVITLDKYYVFYSYNSLIAIYDREHTKLVLGCDFDYSVTTLKYLKQFLDYYCYSIYRELPSGKSLKDSLYKAIESGLIIYDEKMV